MESKQQQKKEQQISEAEDYSEIMSEFQILSTQNNSFSQNKKQIDPDETTNDIIIYYDIMLIFFGSYECKWIDQKVYFVIVVIIFTYDEIQPTKYDNNKNYPYVEVGYHHGFEFVNKGLSYARTNRGIPLFNMRKNHFEKNNLYEYHDSDSENDNERKVLYDMMTYVKENLSDEHLQSLMPKQMILDLNRSLTEIHRKQQENGALNHSLTDYLENKSPVVHPKEPNHHSLLGNLSNMSFIPDFNNLCGEQVEENKNQIEEDFSVNKILNGELQLIKQNQQQFLQSLPEALEQDEEEEESEAIYKLVVEEDIYNQLDQEHLKEYLGHFLNTFRHEKEECRHIDANKDGGKQCTNKQIRNSLRQTGKDIIKEIGKKIISGDFDLTTISFPIKCMIPKSALEKALYSTCLFPIYISKAASINDPVERLKLVICATIGQFYLNLSFLKPLNPILGETCQAEYIDGTQLYAEQIHGNFSILNYQNYTYFGNYNYESNAGLNSLSLKNKGKREIQFTDGQHIEYNFGKEVYSGVFWGHTAVETLGTLTFKDKKNNLKAKLIFDDVSRRPTDFFKGKIKQNDEVISKIYGSYEGFCNFDDIRYWDYRYVAPFKPIFKSSVLGSDVEYRKDKILLQRGHLKLAQDAKEELEQRQREDRQNRKNQAKIRRKNQEN